MQSQNGWTIRPDLIHYYSIPGGRIGLREGDVATVLLEWCRDLQKIEPAHWPGIWGYALRPIRGQTTGYSNHASGTAVDWNAPRHPRQSHDRYAGWSRWQVAQIHYLLQHKYHGLIRWGADYHSTPYDPMHGEINGSSGQIHNLAREIIAANKPKPPVTPPKKKVQKMQWLASTKGLSAVFICDGITRRWVKDARQQASIEERLRAFDLPDTTSAYAPGELASGIAGVLVGPDAPEGTY